jgi:NagD protein
MMRAARKELGLATDETTMIGDTMETDICGGVQLGFHTVLVLSGGARPDDLRRYAYRPETVIQSLAELSELLDAYGWMPPWRLPSHAKAERSEPLTLRDRSKPEAPPRRVLPRR